MKVRSNNSANTVRQAVLAGILTLTGSAVAVAAVPAAPAIDWVEASEQYDEDGQYVAVDVGWSRYDLEAVDSVQYRLDGRPLMSRAVEQDQMFGGAEFAIEKAGSFGFTVALCNADGCVESDPVTISIADEDGIDVSFDVLQDSSEDVTPSAETSNAPQNDFTMMMTTMSPMTTGLATTLASELGKAALKGIARAGANYGFSTLMDHLGLGEEDFGSQIAELDSSLNAMNVSIQKLTTAIENLEDEVVWQGFLTQHTNANNAVNQIYSNYEDVVGWIEQGGTDRESWTTARSKIKTAVTTLAGSKTNGGGGVIDVRDGAIYQLMNAIPQRVASVESYWPTIDEYRDYYRTAVSFAYLTLDLIEDAFDGTGTTRVMADNALEAGQMAVLNMYSYGIAPELPVVGTDVLDFVHLRGKTVGWTSVAAAELDESTVAWTAGLYLRDMFYDIQDQYRGEHHDYQTIEEFLQASNVPTRYVRSSTMGWKSTGWEVTNTDLGSPHQGIPPSYELKPRIVEIKGDSWQERYTSLCSLSNGAICGNVYDDTIYAWTDDDIMSVIQQRQAAIDANGGFKVGGKFAHTHFGLVDLTDRLNHAGHAANLDADAVELAAFGE